MRYRLLIAELPILILVCQSALCLAADDERARPEAARSRSSPSFITITINPEGRISVILTRNQETAPRCGSSLLFPVRILNQAFLTAPLEASLIDAPTDTRVDFSSERLTGAVEEDRQLRLTLERPGLTDITISFHLHNDIQASASRDRIHFLAHCIPTGNDPG